MRRVIETIYLQSILTNSIMGLPNNPIAGTTLNEYLDLPILVYTGTPTITYYTLGIIKKELEGEIDSIEHSPLDVTLYEHIPLLIVAKEIGLSAEQLNEYGLIKDIVVEGVEYIACYSKRIDGLGTHTDVLSVNYDNVNNKYKIDNFTFTEDMIGKPTPKPSKDYVFNIESPSIAVSSKLNISLSTVEVDNIKHVLDTMYDSEVYLTDRISEVGIVANNEKDGYFQHTHYVKVNKYFSNLTLDKNHIIDLDIGGMIPINL